MNIENLKVEDLTAGKVRKMSPEQQKAFYDNFTQRFSSSITSSIKRVNSMNQYNPSSGRNATMQIGGGKKAPTQAELKEWISDPQSNAKNLRKAGKYLEDVIMQYQRALDHFKKILTFQYDLRMQSPWDESKKEEILNGHKRVLGFLRDFDVKYQAHQMMEKVMSNGGVFYYFQDGDDFKTLIELPIDYCYVTGRWDRGFTFAIDVTWLDKVVDMRKSMPELYNYYDEFNKLREANAGQSLLKQYRYFPVPIDKGVVFSFDPSDVEMIPPLTGVFRDANSIFTYKNLLMQKTALDTWKILGQKIPIDEETQLPLFTPEQAQMFVDFVQQVLPEGTAVFATPMDFESVDLSDTNAQNSIVGRGEELYWRTVGVNGTMMDAGDKSATTLSYSLDNDEGFVSHLYLQWEQFLNLQLRLVSRQHRFAVKFYGNRYRDMKDAKDIKEFVVGTNIPVGKMYGLLGYEPFEVTSTIELENALKIKDKSKPIISGSQMSSKDSGGAPTKDDGELTPNGEQTRANDSNNNRNGGAT